MKYYGYSVQIERDKKDTDRTTKQIFVICESMWNAIDSIQTRYKGWKITRIVECFDDIFVTSSVKEDLRQRFGLMDDFVQSDFPQGEKV